MNKGINVMLDIFNNNVFDLLNYIVAQENNKYKIDSKLVFSDFNENCNSYTENGTIYLKKILLSDVDFTNDIKKNNNIYCLVKNIYHEFAHLRQIYDAEHSNINNDSLFYIVTYLINKYGDCNYYLRNYKYQFIELSADEYAYNSILNIPDNDSLIINNINDVINEINLRKKIIYRVNDDGNELPIFDYFPNILKNIIKNNTNLLNEFPSLLNFFTNDGSFKKIDELINDDINIKIYDKCFTFFKYLYFNEILNFEFNNEISDYYIKIFELFVDDYITSFEYLLNYRLIGVKEINFSIQYYRKNAKIVLDKIDIILGNNLYDKLILYKNKLLSLMEK